MEKMEKTTSKTNDTKKADNKSKTPPISQNGRTEPKKAEATKEAKTVAMLTPSDRFAKAEQFGSLQQKYERLKMLSNNLKNFKLQDENLNSKIKLVNGQGGELTISHPDAIKEVLQICESKLSNALSETELEVMSFHI